MSVGLEDAEDLIADIEQALKVSSCVPYNMHNLFERERENKGNRRKEKRKKNDTVYMVTI